MDSRRHVVSDNIIDYEAASGEVGSNLDDGDDTNDDDIVPGFPTRSHTSPSRRAGHPPPEPGVFAPRWHSEDPGAVRRRERLRDAPTARRRTKQRTMSLGRKLTRAVSSLESIGRTTTFVEVKVTRMRTIAALEKTDRHLAWLGNFHFVTAMAFAVKGMASPCLDFAPLILPMNNITQVGSMVLWSTLTLGCIFGAGPVIAVMGSKRALFCGMLLFDVFFVLFLGCALIGPCAMQWVLFMASMLSMGLGASLLLTAVCIYMTQIAAVLAEESPEETLAELTAHLGGSLAVWSLATEVVFRLVASALARFRMPDWAAIALWSVLGLLCTLLLLCSREAPLINSQASSSKPPIRAKVVAFFALWGDPKLWLLGFNNFTFFWTQALILNYINPAYVAPMLGKSSIGIIMSTVSVSGAVLAKLYSSIAAYMGNGPILFIASASFAVVPLAAKFTTLCTEGGWKVLILYVCFGSGRAVHEGVNRAVFAEYFPGPQLDAAFANYNFQGSAMAVVANLAQTVASENVLLGSSLGLALATTPCFLLAAGMQHPNDTHGAEDDTASSSGQAAGDDASSETSSSEGDGDGGGGGSSADGLAGV